MKKSLEPCVCEEEPFGWISGVDEQFRERLVSWSAFVVVSEPSSFVVVGALARESALSAAGPCA